METNFYYIWSHLHELRVLELGCGPGLPVTAKLLLHPAVHVTANISTVQIELARANLGANAGNGAGQGRLVLVEGDMGLNEKGWAFWSGWGKEETLRTVEEAGL